MNESGPMNNDRLMDVLSLIGETSIVELRYDLFHHELELKLQSWLKLEKIEYFIRFVDVYALYYSYTSSGDRVLVDASRDFPSRRTSTLHTVTYLGEELIQIGRIEEDNQIHSANFMLEIEESFIYISCRGFVFDGGDYFELYPKNPPK